MTLGATRTSDLHTSMWFHVSRPSPGRDPARLPLADQSVGGDGDDGDALSPVSRSRISRRPRSRRAGAFASISRTRPGVAPLAHASTAIRHFLRYQRYSRVTAHFGDPPPLNDSGVFANEHVAIAMLWRRRASSCALLASGALSGSFAQRAARCSTPARGAHGFAQARRETDRRIAQLGSALAARHQQRASVRTFRESFAPSSRRPLRHVACRWMTSATTGRCSDASRLVA